MDKINLVNVKGSYTEEDIQTFIFNLKRKFRKNFEYQLTPKRASIILENNPYDSETINSVTDYIETYAEAKGWEV